MSEKKKLTPDIKAPDIKEAINLLIKRGYPGFNLRPEDLNGEKWKDIPGYKGLYQVSNLGRVKSFAHYNYDKGRIKGTIMKQYFRIYRSLQPRFAINLLGNYTENFDTNALVGKAFLGKKKANEVYAHINKDVLDNRAENLKIMAKGDNRKLKYKFCFIRQSDNKRFLRDELEKEYKKTYRILSCNINRVIRAGKKGYGSFWRKEYLPELRNGLSFSNIRLDRISKKHKEQIDSAYKKKYVFTTSKKDTKKKHISVIRHKGGLEKRRMKLTERERKKYAGFNAQLEDLKGERWEDVPGYEGLYCVSNLGRVKTYGRYRTDGYWFEKKIIKQRLHIRQKRRFGLSVCLHQNNIIKYFQVSALVGMAFIRERKTNEVYAHLNKDQLDNRLENIKVITWTESIKLNFATNVSLAAKYEFIRLADGKQFLQQDIIKEYGSKHVLSGIRSGIKKNKIRYGSFWEKRILK